MSDYSALKSAYRREALIERDYMLKELLNSIPASAVGVVYATEQYRGNLLRAYLLQWTLSLDIDLDHIREARASALKPWGNSTWQLHQCAVSDMPLDATNKTDGSVI